MRGEQQRGSFGVIAVERSRGQRVAKVARQVAVVVGLAGVRSHCVLDRTKWSTAQTSRFISAFGLAHARLLSRSGRYGSQRQFTHARVAVVIGESALDSPLIKKLEQFTPFSDQDRQLLNELTSRRQKQYGPREDVVREGEHKLDIHIVLSGLACRYKTLEDGSRQIMAFLIPGNPCDYETFILKEMDHSIATLAPSVIAAVSGDVMKDMLLNRSGIALALWWSTLQDLTIPWRARHRRGPSRCLWADCVSHLRDICPHACIRHH